MREQIFVARSGKTQRKTLGNMLCIRGFARMGNLAIVSKADESYQRDLIKEHKKEVLDLMVVVTVYLQPHGQMDFQRAVF